MVRSISWPTPAGTTHEKQAQVQVGEGRSMCEVGGMGRSGHVMKRQLLAQRAFCSIGGPSGRRITHCQRHVSLVFFWKQCVSEVSQAGSKFIGTG